MSLTVIADALSDLLACAEAAVDPPPKAVRVMSGDPTTVAYDVCETDALGRDGQLFVHLYGVEADPETYGDGGCTTFDASVDVAIIRCAETVEDDGSPPPDGDLTAESLRVLDDAAALLRAVVCCWRPSVRFGVEPLRWSSIGPEGGCVGGRWELRVEYSECRCPDEESP